MEILITKGSGVQLANPVCFRVTLLTVEDALARGVISEFDPENQFSPNRAGKFCVLSYHRFTKKYDKYIIYSSLNHSFLKNLFYLCKLLFCNFIIHAGRPKDSATQFRLVLQGCIQEFILGEGEV